MMYTSVMLILKAHLRKHFKLHNYWKLYGSVMHRPIS